MKLLITILAIFFIGSNGLIVLQVFKVVNSVEAGDKEKIAAKIITITVEIKNHLPIRKDLKIKNKYYLKTINEKITLINVINALNISNVYFDILALDLNQDINEEYKLILVPRSNAIRYYSRYTITFQPLVNLGLNSNDAKQVLLLFNNQSLDADQLLVNLTKLLVTTKRKYIELMHKFIAF